MRKLVARAAVAGALAAVMFGSVDTANAVPSGPQTVDQVVGQLRSQGYHVILSRVGTAPLDRCSVSAVRPGHTYARTDSGVPGAGNDLVTTVTDMTAYVDVTC
jgi:FlaG/FlaF family flagellin (archaellin)